MGAILEITEATKLYGGLAANEGITFDVNEGEIVGVVGPNGAGKTTLFNSISGAHNLTRGSIIFEGTNITDLKAHSICKKGIGRTFQIPQSLNEMTVWENVLVGALNHTSRVDKASDKVLEILEFCSLDHMKDMLAGKLNVAQKKRLEIARAMATSPKLLLLDETMAGLTATERKEAVELIRKINARGITVLTIEHNMDVVMTVSSRVVVLVSGQLLMEGTPEEITTHPEVIKAYLGGDATDDE